MRFIGWFFAVKMLKPLLPYVITITLTSGSLYGAFISQLGRLPDVTANRVVLLGRVEQTYDHALEKKGVYLLKDPTGSGLVITERGAPAPAAFVLVWATVQRLDSGRIMLIEERRIGTF